MSTVTPRRKKRKKRKPKPGCVPVKAKRKRKKKHHAAVPHSAAVKHKKKRRKRRTCKKPPKLRPQSTHPAPAKPADGGSPAPGPAPVVPQPPAPTGPLHQIVSPIGVYQGAFGREQAKRLLFRAGFGPRPGDIDRLVALGLEGAVLSLTRPVGSAPMTGPEPTVDGAPLLPLDTR